MEVVPAALEGEDMGGEPLAGDTYESDAERLTTKKSEDFEEEEKSEYSDVRSDHMFEEH